MPGQQDEIVRVIRDDRGKAIRTEPVDNAPNFPGNDLRTGGGRQGGGNGGGDGGSDQRPNEQQPTADEILDLVRLWLNGDTENGISPNAGKKAMSAIGEDADQVDTVVAAFNASTAEEASAGGGAGAAGGGGPIGEGIDEDFFFASPEERGLQLQTTRGGRQQLFNEFISQGLPTFGGGIARRAAQSRFNLFSASFNLDQAISGGPGGLFDETSQSFTDFLGGAVPTGGQIRGQLGDLLGTLGGPASEITGGGFSFLDQLGDIDFSGQGRGIAFNTANAASGLGQGNPFRQGFGNLLGRQLDRFLGQGGTPLDFLNQFSQQGFGSFF